MIQASTIVLFFASTIASPCPAIDCGHLKGSAAAADAACEKADNCISGKRTLGAADIGCFVAYNSAVVTAADGFTGELQTRSCTVDPNVVPALIMEKGAKVVSVTTNGGKATAHQGSQVSKITTNGGSVTGTASDVQDIILNGGDVNLDAGSSSVQSIRLNGGKLQLTASSVAMLSVNGGAATIRKAKVEAVSTNGGSVELQDGATAGKYKSNGGSCDGCPASAATGSSRTGTGSASTMFLPCFPFCGTKQK